MSEPLCTHQWQVSRSLSGSRMLHSTEVDPVVVLVNPQHDTVGPFGDGRTSKLSLEEGEWAGPLEKPEK